MKSKDDDCPCGGGDRLRIGPDRGDGVHHCIRHMPDHSVQQGWASPVRDGEPIHDAELVHITPDPAYGDYRVQSLHGGASQPQPQPDSSAAGPPMVSNNKYRAGWDRIFGSKQVVGSA
jgi:hypothetical protein